MLTVITPAETYDLVTAQAAASALGIDPDADNLDTQITQASDAIAKACNRVFAVEGVAETLRNQCRTGIVVLSRFPVTEVASIVENGTTLVAGTDYQVDLRTGIITRLRGDRETWWPFGKIVVTYSAGYADVPPALAAAATTMVQHFRSQAGQALLLRSEEVPGILTNTYADYPSGGALPPQVEALIADYRKPVGG